MKNNHKSFLYISGGSLLMLAASFLVSQLDLPLLAGLLGVMAAGVLFALFLKKPLWGLVVMVFLLPLERIGSAELGGFTLRASQIVAILMIVAYVWEQLASRRFSFRKNPIALPVLVFLIANLFSFSNAVNIDRALQVFVFTLFVVLASFVVPQLVTRKKHVNLILKSLFASAVLVSVFGLFQFMGDLVGVSPEITGLSDLYTKKVFGFPRVQSTALEPLYFANYLLLPLSIAAALLLSKLKKNTWFWLGLVLLLGLNLVMTLSRGGYLGAAAVVLVLAIVFWNRIFTFKNVMMYVAGAIVLISAASFLLSYSHNAREAVETFQTQALNYQEGASIIERQGTMSQALDVWKEHPYLGIGTGNFGPSVARNPLMAPDKGWLIANNETVEILSETGILGLASFVSILVVLFVRSIKAIRVCSDKRIKIILIGAFAAFAGIIVQYQTFSTLYILHIWFLFGFLVALQNIALEPQRATAETKNIQNT
ncbi:O-antigen ligase family protein [Patescibacteria group bacterium]